MFTGRAMLKDVLERRERFFSFSAVTSLPEEAGLEGTKEITGSSCAVFIASLCGVEVPGAASWVGSTWPEEGTVACDGEGVWPRKTDPRMESGIWKKEAFVVGEAARGGEYSWPCLAAASAVNISSSMAPTTGWRVTCCDTRQYIRKPWPKQESNQPARMGRHCSYDGRAKRAVRLSLDVVPLCQAQQSG